MAESTRIRTLIVLAAMLSPLAAGAIIWYSLRRTHGSFAHLGNWISFGSFFLLWPAVALTWRLHLTTNPVTPALQVLGAALSIVAVWSARRVDASLTAVRSDR
jgi:hypothetical protein